LLTETLISAEDVSLTLSRRESTHEILSGVSFSVAPGESLAVAGPSGSGKSVLLRVLAGLWPPTSGVVRFEGQPLYPVATSRRRSLARSLGIAFQKGGLIDALTVFENLALPLREVTEASEREVGARVGAALEAVGLKGTDALRPEELSGGMQKRLGVARAFLMADKLVILDDPTAGLDPVTAVAILDLVAKLKQEKGLAMLLVGSQPEEVLPLCDRIVFLEQGRVTAEGTVAEVTAKATGTARKFFQRSSEADT